jgi:hypothetical protein
VTGVGRRKELRAQYQQRQLRAGVYALRNAVTGRMLVASTADLDAVRNRLEFARSTGTPSALDGRLVADVRQYGIDAFVLAVLDTLTLAPGMTPDDVRADLAALEQLWREKLAADPHY